MTSRTIKRYALTDKQNVGSTRLSEYITRATREELEQYRVDEWETPIVELNITFNFPEPELPTAVGSVIRAKHADYDYQALWALTEDQDDIPWRGLSEGADWAAARDLKDVEILFDAATIN